MQKSCRKCAPKGSSRPLLLLVNISKQSLHARDYFKNKIFWKSLEPWSLEKVNFFFSSEPSPISDIINHSTSICPSVPGNCGKKGKKLQKFEYPENDKSFLDEIKSTFHSFWRAIIWWKNKKLIKNSRHKL